MSENVVYTASVYQRDISYQNFNGEERTLTLYFCLDPITLMSLIASLPERKSKSGNPAKAGQVEFNDSDQLNFVTKIALAAAGEPSLDGESWDTLDGFEFTLAGKAFLAKLVSSDADRKEFADKVILDPFRAFVNYAKADPTNSKKEVQNFVTMLNQMERVFSTDTTDLSVEERRALLQKELEQLGES